MTRTLLHYDH